MNNVVIFNFKNNELRTELKNGEPWFCLADCCKALEIKSPKDAVKQLKQKGAALTRTLTNGGIQKLIFINEPNLYRLVFRSRKPQAQAFADWVYSEVLPQIRKTGAYGTPAVTDNKKALKTIGGIVKRCAAAAVREEVGNAFAAQAKSMFADFAIKTFAMGQDLKPFQRVTDDMLLRGLYDWYATKHHDFKQAIDDLTAENDRLKSKIATIKKTID